MNRVGVLSWIVPVVVLLVGELRAGDAASSSLAGVDSAPARKLIGSVDAETLAAWGRAGPFLRIRKLADPAQREVCDAERAATERLTMTGFKSVALFQWSPKDWAAGVRGGGGHRLPLDLREAFRRARAYAVAYSCQLSAVSSQLQTPNTELPAPSSELPAPSVSIGFEFDNEPDIDFVLDNPETYAAFLKACWLGVHDAELARGEEREARGVGDAEPAISCKLSAVSSGPQTSESERANSRGGAEMQRSDDDVSGGEMLTAYRLPLIASYLWRPGVLGVPAVGGRFSAAARRGDGTKRASAEMARSNGACPARSGGEEAGHRQGRPPNRSEVGDGMDEAASSKLPAPSATAGVPRVVMAPMAFPPGPYFEQLLRNGVLGYTDAFNYHFYGCAADFTGAYRAFEDAVATASEMGDGRSEIGGAAGAEGAASAEIPELRTPNSELRQTHLRKRQLPVLLTEYGYNRLTGPQSKTVAGRVAQWRWFRDVGRQIEDLRIAGPMAFYLPPFLENGSLEFGLTMAPAAPTGGKPESGNLKPEDGLKPKLEISNPAPVSDLKSQPSSSIQVSGLNRQVSEFTAGGLTFTARDFTTDFEHGDSSHPISHLPSPISGAASAAPWLRWIGTRVGENEMSPALAWLIQEGIDHPYTPRDWTVTTPAPSPVVIDFVAEPTLEQFKRYSGYVATESSGDAREGTGNLILYNFSRAMQRGRIEVTSPEVLVDPATVDREFTLAPMGRTAVPLRFRIPADRFVRHDWSIRFVPADGRTSPAVLATAFYPDTVGMGMQTVTPIAGTNEAASRTNGNRDFLLRRRIEPEEGRPVATEGSPWLVTSGDTLTETSPGHWAFTVARFTGDTIPAVAELPLPDDFTFPDDGLLALRFRLADPPGRTDENGTYLHIYFRTANGNIYGVMPWSYATGEWDSYVEAKGNYTLLTDGRTNLPWRFRDNRIVSIVLMSWRRGVPLTYEVEDPRIVRVARLPADAAGGTRDRN